MSRGRHAQPRPPRSDVPVLILITLLAAGVATAPWVFDDADVLRGAVSALALLCVVAVVIAQRSRRRQVTWLKSELAERTTETRQLRLALERVNTIHFELAGEVAYLREQIAQYVAPVPAPPDPIYPSLHLPLVRAAFAQQMQPTSPTPPSPSTSPSSGWGSGNGERANIGVEADSGSDTMPPRQLLDLTASEVARLRQAN